VAVLSRPPARACFRGRGRSSGVFTTLRYGTVWTLRDGKVTSIITHTDPAEALKVVGLEA